jgi:hypothetical protein
MDVIHGAYRRRLRNNKNGEKAISLIENYIS